MTHSIITTVPWMLLFAGSGGVRASRFAAQYYNAKVAVVELPFGFVSSESVGGKWLVDNTSGSKQSAEFDTAQREECKGHHVTVPCTPLSSFASHQSFLQLARLPQPQSE